MDYGPVPDPRREEFEQVAHYAFTPEEEPGSGGRLDDPSLQLGDRRALFEDDELTAVCRLLELEARCRGSWITLGGLRSVATPPEYRREGRAARLMQAALAEYSDRGVPLVALWPFDHDFYADLGWAATAKRAKYRLPPDSLEPLASNETGRLFRPTPDEWERLRAVNLADGEGTSLSLRRSEYWWRHRVFERSGTRRHVYAWERDGDLESYVVYTVENEANENVLRVRDLAAVDDRAFRHACWLLYNHDSQVDWIDLTGDPCGTPGTLLDRVASPETVTCELEHGAMVRIADVTTALETVSYPSDLDFTGVVDVADDLAEWNDARFELRIAGGDARCRRLAADERGGDGPPDVSVGVGTLSQLVVGYCDVARGTRIGTLRFEEEAARDALAAAFPGHPVELSEFF